MRRSSRTPVTASLMGALLLAGVAGARTSADPPQWIVFAATPPGGTVVEQLFRIETTGNGLQQITTGRRNAIDPSFSPDGKRIVFTRLGAGIFVINLDGTGLRRLTKRGRDHFPVWSPDGKRIAFIRLFRNEFRLHVMSPSGRGVRRLPLAPPGGRPSWSASSKSIYVPVLGGLEKLDARTGRSQHRTALRIDLLSGGSATVSPNSTRVGFVGPRPSAEGCEEPSCVVFGLYMANLPGGRQRRIFNDAGPPGWSSDSKRIVFVFRNTLSFWPVAGGARTSIPVGNTQAAGNTSPAWQRG